MEGNSTPLTTTKQPLIGASGAVYNHSERFALWVKLFTDKTNHQTFGKHTAAAAVAYGHDMTTEDGYNAAWKIGNKNHKKFQDLAALFLDKKGVTYEFWMEILLAKMATSQSVVWWEIVGELMGWRERKPVQLNQQNNYNIYNGATDDELETLFGAVEETELSTQELTDLLIKGTLPTGAEQNPVMELHQGEFSSGDSPESSMSEPPRTI